MYFILLHVYWIHKKAFLQANFEISYLKKKNSKYSNSYECKIFEEVHYFYKAVVTTHLLVLKLNKEDFLRQDWILKKNV